MGFLESPDGFDSAFASSRESLPPSRNRRRLHGISRVGLERHLEPRRRPRLDNGPRRWREESPIQVAPPFPRFKKRGLSKPPSPGPPPGLEGLQCGIVIGPNPIRILGWLAHSSCLHHLSHLPSAGALGQGQRGGRSRGCRPWIPLWIPFPDVVRNFSPPFTACSLRITLFLAGFAVVAPFADVASCRSFLVGGDWNQWLPLAAASQQHQPGKLASTVLSPSVFPEPRLETRNHRTHHRQDGSGCPPHGDPAPSTWITRAPLGTSSHHGIPRLTGSFQKTISRRASFTRFSEQRHTPSPYPFVSRPPRASLQNVAHHGAANRPELSALPDP